MPTISTWSGASSIYSSARDLIGLKNGLSDQRAVLKEATIDQMYQIVPPAVDQLGFSVRTAGPRVGTRCCL